MQKNWIKRIILIFTIIFILTGLAAPIINAINIENKETIITYNEQDQRLRNFNDYININVEETWEFLTDTENGIQIPIDVRKNYEWNEKRIDTPVPENPRFYCLDLLQNSTMLEQFLNLYAGIDVIMYCRSGGRSAVASQILVDNGFTGQIYNMVGGINAWIDAEYPILTGGITNISVEESYELLTDTANGIQTPIDVRTLEEWLSEFIDTPPPENAYHHPLSDLEDEEKLQEFLELYDGRELVLYCHSGVRSLIAAEILVENEFTGTIYNMLGGIVAWKTAGYPTITLEPHLYCSGSLQWTKVEPGSTVKTTLSIENIGDTGSLLDWRIDSHPVWGNWTFEPSSGYDLPTENTLTVFVNVTAPEEAGTEFIGDVKIINMENASDFIILPVYLKTPRNKLITNILFLRIFKLFPNVFPIVRYLLRM